ncbi:hypothetical protein DICPUDRAFT_35226 [Dictyostelium purpureum]|uniref:EGF-like domain-containing protein n=1 Tax=Dictyostelium purpureum TaxID=5786 RepID=F0ZP22_DICPU|nr:uncharacterized protein DICPUDRAFT_35226 [Dictyostelium purpureum]EGC34293.1 hypothetical protein DICPUDRAFT_35226 [Dictyostelium purpureum]|eukprot:XP_003289175.1 hypothetical protein DICPUDRAFT_35226 [Dictyostelium purpureum]
MERDFPKNFIFALEPLNAGYPLLSSQVIEKKIQFPSVWNETLGLFQIEFYVEANSPIGDFYFNIVSTKLLSIEGDFPSQAFNEQLRIKKTKMDLIGPAFKKITKFNQKFTESNQSGQLGWSIIIEDPVNGFKSGYITVKGELDQSIYNFSISINNVKSGGTVFIGEYDIFLTASSPCITQNYFIEEVYLLDRMGRSSIFLIKSPNLAMYTSISNPFIYYLNDSSINKVLLECPTIIDISPPKLNTFSVSSQIIDTSKSNRTITFLFSAIDEESGLKDKQYPIVYLSTSKNSVIECVSSIDSITSFMATYSCSVELPFGFGNYANISLISVYGFINNNGYYSGYSSFDLMKSVQNFPYYVNITFQTTQPVITGYCTITEKGGDLFIYGRGFQSDIFTAPQAHIVFGDGSTSTNVAKAISPTVFKISNVKPTEDPYKVKVYSGSTDSNRFTIVPMVYNFNNRPPVPEKPTDTPIPTNKPQLCLGSPVCGGPTHGQCIEDQGCVCYSPWIGNDCQSKIIIVDPTINNTAPSTEITIPTDNTNGIPVKYSSLISLISLREINATGDVIFEKSFEKWTVKDLDNTTFIYDATLQINKNNNNPIAVDITTTLKWFVNETTITFANEELKMNPSSMKYTVQISNYPFESQLNQLQLVMFASIQSNSTDNICSFRDFGETTSGDNSNYIKIQVDNHSLYGRFIRRGIIDSTIRAITNIPLDAQMKPIGESKLIQSYIGIQIPYFRELALIDPDFSVLIDSDSASSKSGSICPSNSKLSGVKIAGIVIGAAAFTAIITISIVYFIIQKRKGKLFKDNLNIKMKNINN